MISPDPFTVGGMGRGQTAAPPVVQVGGAFIKESSSPVRLWWYWLNPTDLLSDVLSFLGEQYQPVRCFEADMGVVEESLCDPDSRPEDRHRKCKNMDCPARSLHSYVLQLFFFHCQHCEHLKNLGLRLSKMNINNNINNKTLHLLIPPGIGS